MGANISFFEDQFPIPLKHLDFNSYHKDFSCPHYFILQVQFHIYPFSVRLSSWLLRVT